MDNEKTLSNFKPAIAALDTNICRHYNERIEKLKTLAGEDIPETSALNQNR